MGYNVPMDRVDLGDGQWADIFKEVLHRTKRQIQEIAQPFFDLGGGHATMKIDSEGAVSADVKGDIEVDITKLPLSQITDIMIVGQVAAWSFADEVNHETLGMLSSTFHEKLKTEVNARFADPLLVSKARASESLPSSRSNGERRFPWLSRKP